MNARPLHLEPGAVARAREMADRRLTAEELQAALGQPISETERAEILSLIDWFCRRYPAPADRLAYVRRAYRRWVRARQNEPDLYHALGPVTPAGTVARLLDEERGER